jgi:VanZ family protein
VALHPVIPIICSILWMLMIFYFSSLPAGSTGPDTLLFKVISKSSHFIIFGVLSVLYLFSLKWKKSLQDTGLGTFILSLIMAVLYAVTDEYHQSFSSGRYPRITDVLLDSSGALAFLGTVYKLKHRKNRLVRY